MKTEVIFASRGLNVVVLANCEMTHWKLKISYWDLENKVL